MKTCKQNTHMHIHICACVRTHTHTHTHTHTQTQKGSISISRKILGHPDTFWGTSKSLPQKSHSRAISPSPVLSLLAILTVYTKHHYAVIGHIWLSTNFSSMPQITIQYIANTMTATYFIFFFSCTWDNTISFSIG
jgi:hypothetical protein